MLAVDFWEFNVGHIFIVMAMTAQFVWWLIRYDRRIGEVRSAVESLINDTTKTFEAHRRSIEELNTRINSIDATGTRKSQQSIMADEQLGKLNMDRIAKLEVITDKWIPQIAAGVADIHWIKNYIQRNGIAKNGSNQNAD